MSTSDAHLDVASYALGVLDAEGMARFEEHLVTCDACAAELEALLPVTQALSDVDRADFAAAVRRDGPREPGPTLQPVPGPAPIPPAPDRIHDEERLRNVVAFERRRGRVRTGVVASAAAAVAAVLALGIGSAVFSGDPAGSPPGGRGAAAGRATVAAPSASASAPGTTTTFGFTNPSLPPAVHHTAKDPRSGAALDASLQGADWGTQLTVALTGVKGPLDCTLFIFSRDGSSQPAGAWKVPVAGYGTPEHPDPLVLAASTSWSADQIARIDIRAVAADGSPSTLVSVPL